MVGVETVGCVAVGLDRLGCVLMCYAFSVLPSLQMPTILRVDGYRLFFYSNERAEPPHVHVAAGSAIAKYWLADGALAAARGFPPHELAVIARIIRCHRGLLEERWHEYFGR
jgi:hypothetical protein